jgi:hypothetical protein
MPPAAEPRVAWLVGQRWEGLSGGRAGGGSTLDGIGTVCLIRCRAPKQSKLGPGRFAPHRGPPGCVPAGPHPARSLPRQRAGRSS